MMQYRRHSKAASSIVNPLPESTRLQVTQQYNDIMANGKHDMNVAGLPGAISSITTSLFASREQGIASLGSARQTMLASGFTQPEDPIDTALRNAMDRLANRHPSNGNGHSNGRNNGRF